MRIASVEVTEVVEHGQRANLLVVRSESGLHGVSEIATGSIEYAERSAGALVDLLVGRDAFAVEALLMETARAGISVDPTLVAAATAAMLDLAARSLDVPIHQLLGGRVRDEVRVCAVDWGEGVRADEDVVAAARRAVTVGHTALRVDPVVDAGRSRDVETASRRIGAIREAVPDEVDLVVVAPRDLDLAAAIEFAGAIDQLEPMWLEAPVPTVPLARLEHVAERVTVPLAAGRGLRPDVLRDMIRSNLVDHVVLEVDRVGGLLEARKIAALAEIYHVGVIPAASGGSISLNVALQLAAVVPNLSIAEVPMGSTDVQGGTIMVDRRPGGATPLTPAEATA